MGEENSLINYGDIRPQYIGYIGIYRELLRHI
jgi:hypothetical protein